MKTFNVAKGTVGLLLIQEDNEDLTTKNWTVSKDLAYTTEHILVDPVKLANYGLSACGCDKDSPAARLARDGYIVFSADEAKTSKHMLAVRYDQVNIT